MIQVLKRAFLILRKVAEDHERVWKLAELAEIADVKHDTCCHIVKSLCEFGYLESCGKRMGYRLGPAINALGNKVIYRQALMEKITPMLEEFFSKFHVPVNLCRAAKDERYIICRAGYSEWGYNRAALGLHDLYTTATGLILAANYSRDEQVELLQARPIPTSFSLGGNPPLEDVLAYLDEIKSKPYFELLHGDNIRKIAFPIYDHSGRVQMAIGCYLAEFQYTKVFRVKLLEALRGLSERIEMLLKQSTLEA